MLGDMDIEVETVEETALAEEPEKAAEAEWVEEPAEAEETERAPGETADPVRMYLQEMGNVPLLTREEEVAIAKEIEAGERDVREGVFSLDLALQYVLNLGDRLKRGEIEARHVFGDDDATAESRPDGRGHGGQGGQAGRRVPEARRQAPSLARPSARSWSPSAARPAPRRSARRRSTSGSRSSPQRSARSCSRPSSAPSTSTTLVDKLKEAQRLIDTRDDRRQALGGPARASVGRDPEACRPHPGRREGRLPRRGAHVPGPGDPGRRRGRRHPRGAAQDAAGVARARHDRRRSCAARPVDHPPRRDGRRRRASAA